MLVEGVWKNDGEDGCRGGAADEEDDDGDEDKDEHSLLWALEWTAAGGAGYLSLERGGRDGSGAAGRAELRVPRGQAAGQVRAGSRAGLRLVLQRVTLQLLSPLSDTQKFVDNQSVEHTQGDYWTKPVKTEWRTNLS